MTSLYRLVRAHPNVEKRAKRAPSTKDADKCYWALTPITSTNTPSSRERNKVPPRTKMHPHCLQPMISFSLNTLTWLFGSPSRLHICGTILLSVKVCAPELKTKAVLYCWWEERKAHCLSSLSPLPSLPPWAHRHLPPRLTPYLSPSASKLNAHPHSPSAQF